MPCIPLLVTSFSSMTLQFVPRNLRYEETKSLDGLGTVGNGRAGSVARMPAPCLCCRHGPLCRTFQTGVFPGSRAPAGLVGLWNSTLTADFGSGSSIQFVVRMNDSFA